MNYAIDEKFLELKLGYPMNFGDMLMQFKANYETTDNLEIIEHNYDCIKGFFEDVNENICKTYDANYGINWDTIDMAIEHVLQNLDTPD